MSSGMNMQEAEKVAENMSYRQAVINCLYARCVPYRKATKIKMKQLLEIAEKRDEKIKHDKQIKADAIDEFVNWAYMHGVSFSFMGKIKEDGTSDVADRLDAIKSDFYKQIKEQSNGM